MAQIDVINRKGEVVGSIELNDTVFAIEPNQQALFDAIIMQQAGKRQGTAATKGRSQVSGGGRKPYRQKGTGRARQGSIRAPQYRGGGTVFGATPRDYSYKINKKVRRLALKSALSAKAAAGNVLVVDKLAMGEVKTKTFQAFLNAVESKKAVVVTGDSNVVLSARNIPGIVTSPANLINVYDIVNANQVIIDQGALAAIEEVFA